MPVVCFEETILSKLGALVDSISNANFMKLPVESGNAVKVKEPLSMDLCSQSSCAIPSKEKTDGSKAQSKGSKEKTSMKSKGPKDMNLDDLVANTREVQSPVAVDTQMVTQSHTTFQEFSTSTPAVETPNKKLNAEKAPEGKKKPSDKDEKKVGSGEKAKKKKGSDKQKQAKVEKPSSDSKDKDSGLKVDTKLGSGSKKNGPGVKSNDIAPATTPQPSQLSDRTKDAKTKASSEKKLRKKKTLLLLMNSSCTSKVSVFSAMPTFGPLLSAMPTFGPRLSAMPTFGPRLSAVPTFGPRLSALDFAEKSRLSAFVCHIK